jgi:hypothetical protein
MKTRSRRRGFFLFDTIAGLTLASVLGWVLVTAIVQSQRTQQRLDESAAAMRIAQRVIYTLQQGKPAPDKVDEAQIQVKPAAGGAPVAGRTWVEVSVNYRGRTAWLIGLTPQGGRP